MTISDGMKFYAINHPETSQVRRYVAAHRIDAVLDMRDCLYPNFMVTEIGADQVPPDVNVFRFPLPRKPASVA